MERVDLRRLSALSCTEASWRASLTAYFAKNDRDVAGGASGRRRVIRGPAGAGDPLIGWLGWIRPPRCSAAGRRADRRGARSFARDAGSVVSSRATGKKLDAIAP